MSCKFFETLNKTRTADFLLDILIMGQKLQNPFLIKKLLTFVRKKHFCVTAYAFFKQVII